MKNRASDRGQYLMGIKFIPHVDTTPEVDMSSPTSPSAPPAVNEGDNVHSNVEQLTPLSHIDTLPSLWKIIRKAAVCEWNAK